MFWSERYEKPEESIWEELKRMMLNPPSETDKKNKKLQEQAWIDTVLDKAFPQENKTPLLKSGVSYEKSLDPYAEIDSKKDWSEEKKSQKKAEVARIREAAVSREKEINREHLLNQAKNYGGAALEIGSAFVPAYGGPKLVGAVANKLAPKVGRKIAQELASGLLKGASSGTVEGFGRGLIEDENPFNTAIQDTVSGAIGGLGLGAGGAKAEKGIRGNELKKLNDFKLLRKKETDFYKDYIQKTKSKHPQIGNIEYTQAGLETVSKHPNAGRDFASLKKGIEQAEYLGYEQPYHQKHGLKDNIKGFYKLKNKDKEFLIADTSDGAKYYMSKQTGDVSNRPSRVDLTSPNSNITDFTQNLNPSQSAKVYETSTTQTPKSNDEWLKWLKRKRKGML